MMAGRDVGGVGSARRRRDRQLRAFHRHVQLAVKLELATALHHSAQPAGSVVAGPGDEEAHEKYNALRGQTQPPPGMRPALLEEVAVSQDWWLGAPRQPGGDAPSVVPPALAAPAAEAVDGAALSFLLAQTLAAHQPEEEVKEQAAVAEWEGDVVRSEGQLVEELDLMLDASVRPPWSALSPVERAAVQWHAARLKVSKRKEKRRRKRRKKVRRRRRPWPVLMLLFLVPLLT